MKIQFVAMVVSRGLSGLLLTVMTLLVARWAGPASFGQSATVLSVGLFYFVLFDFGMTTFVARAEARGDTSDVAVGLALNNILAILGAVVGVVVIIVLTLFANWSYSLAGIVVSLALDKAADAITSVSVARRDRVGPAVMVLLRRGIALLALLGLYQILSDIILAFAIALAIGSLSAFVYVRLRMRNAYSRKATYSAGRSLLRRAAPFMLANISASTRNLDVGIVSLLGTSAAAGIYSAAQRITSPFLLIPNTLGTMILPAAARGGRRRARAISRRLIVLHLLVFALLAAASVFSSNLVQLTLGPSYVKASSTVAASLLAFPFTALASPLGGILQSQGEERFVARNGVLFALAFIAAVGAGFLWLGPTGAMLGVLVCYLFKSASLAAFIEYRFKS